ncbi:hypothetical protein M569_05942 [Genlisea aurea]|uniref:DUF3511 domain-containing protein n=1 Tax=Genlisea aurea TaxID=192259 RepID=S8CNY4_9LAMI|nr:hypothetical protein M569_05942 [Genlisea aurea]
MADYRSKSFNHGGSMQIEPYRGPPSDFRSHSISYRPSSSSSHESGAPQPWDPPRKVDENTGSALKSWSFSDPEFQRKKRVASYKVYAVEGQVKGSFRKTFRWLKQRYTQMVHGWW